LIALALALCGPAIADDGDLDTSFGNGGFRLVGVSDVYANIIAGMAVQSDGKIVICESSGSSPGLDFLVARFTADGDVDTSFSFDGHTTIDFAGGTDTCNGLVVQPDGKIVVAGTTMPVVGNSDFAIARLNSDGTLDTAGFGAGTGKTVVAFDLGGTNADGANAVALRPDGRIVVAGFAQTETNGSDFAILQLNTDGSRDTGFNLTGRVSVGFNFASSTTKADIASSVAIDNQGRIVAAGAANQSPAAGDDMAVIRLLPNGQLDSDFNADGRATLAFDLGGANGSNSDAVAGILLDHAQRIVLVGYTDSGTTAINANLDIAVARLQPDGSPDATFGIGGKTTVAFDLAPNGTDYASSILEQANGKLMIAGTSLGLEAPPAYEYATIVRLNANGTPDAGFGTVGKRSYNFAQSTPAGQLFNGIRKQGSKIVLGGALNSVDNDHIDMMVARILDELIFANGFDE
jgi:uncharacterized delta-60 repeat protein